MYPRSLAWASENMMITSLYLITICVIVMSYIHPVLTVCQAFALYVLSHLFFTISLWVGSIVTFVLEVQKVRLSEVNFLHDKDLHVSGESRI